MKNAISCLWLDGSRISYVVPIGNGMSAVFFSVFFVMLEVLEIYQSRFCTKFYYTIWNLKEVKKQYYCHMLTALCILYCQVSGAMCCRLDPNPWLFLGHFFAVAFYAVYSIFKSQSLWRLHQSAYRSICVLLSACSIIFPLIWSEVKTIVRL